MGQLRIGFGLLVLTLSCPAYASAQVGGALPDFDGDHKADVGVYRSVNGAWDVVPTSSGVAATIGYWGLPGDVPVPGDYDGDGLTDLAVYRRPPPQTGNTAAPDGVWFVLQSSSNYSTSTAIGFGRPGDIPVPGDYDGDAKTDAAVYRPSSGEWYILRSRDRLLIVKAFTRSNDLPVPADYDGDGRTDVAVYRRSTGEWLVRRSTAEFVTQSTQVWGTGLDTPSPADYDADGNADFAVFRATTGAWSIRWSTTGTTATYTVGALGDTSAPSDFDGDGRADPAVYRASTGTWSILESTHNYAPRSVSQGSASGTALPSASVTLAGVAIRGLSPSMRGADFDGDERADLAVFRPSTGTWYTLESRTGYGTYTVTSFGLNGDVPTPGDFDGSGSAEVTLFRPAEGRWYFTTRNFYFVDWQQFGLNGDVTVPGDYDGDGATDLAVFRPSVGYWYVRSSRNAFGSGGEFPFSPLQWGTSGDVPVAGDYDGDGVVDPAVYSPSSGIWSIRNSTTRSGVFYQLGVPGDIPVQADFDGDGTTDIAAYRPSTGVWQVLYSSGNFQTSNAVQWGLNGDVPVPADYDGDGLTDFAVYRPENGVWYILKSGTAYTQADALQWGLTGDIPVIRRQ